MTKKFKLDIFGLMSKIDKKNFHIWENLSEEERKGFSAFVVMKWMTGCSDVRQIIFMNELINPIAFDLAKHPELQMKMLACASSGQSRRYKFHSLKKKTVKAKGVNVVKDYYCINTREAADALPCLSKQDILNMAEELGYQKEQITKLKAELR